jgi:hypothetical protein
MSVNCGVSFGICAVRLTKVDAAGNVIAGDNSYVTDKPLSIALNPNIETGNTFSVRNGCGCSIARFKANDTFNWFEFTFTAAALEPEMQAFLLGADVIEDGADVVGLDFPGSLACDDDEPAVALEFWTQHVVGSGQDGTYPWFHWVFPKTVWHLGDNTFEEDIAKPVVAGFSRTNAQWGDGPYGDGPPDGTHITEGGYWKTADDPPTAECAAQAVTATS